MALLLSNTGSTDLRLTLVQQPNVTAHFSLTISSLAFSAKRSQFDAGSTTTGSIFFPITPPDELISSTAINTTSRSDVSEMAIVPLSECRIPILTVSSALASDVKTNVSAKAHKNRRRLFMNDLLLLPWCGLARNPYHKSRAGWSRRVIRCTSAHCPGNWFVTLQRLREQAAIIRARLLHPATVGTLTTAPRRGPRGCGR